MLNKNKIQGEFKMHEKEKKKKKEMLGCKNYNGGAENKKAIMSLKGSADVFELRD